MIAKTIEVLEAWKRLTAEGKEPWEVMRETGDGQPGFGPAVMVMSRICDAECPEIADVECGMGQLIDYAYNHAGKTRFMELLDLAIQERQGVLHLDGTREGRHEVSESSDGGGVS